LQASIFKYKTDPTSFQKSVYGSPNNVQNINRVYCYFVIEITMKHSHVQSKWRNALNISQTSVI